MAKFKLSSRSLAKLDGVHPSLVEVVKRAIEVTKVDFGVTYGVRTLAAQKALVAEGRSKTMNSKHLVQSDGYSHAVDLVAYVGADVSWDLNYYDDICDAMAIAAEELEVPIKWGAAWSEGDIRYYDTTAEAAKDAYVKLRRSQGRKPFIDGPHYELIV